MATLTTSFQLLGESYVGNINYGSGSSNLYLRLYGRYTKQNISENKHECEFQSRIYCSGYYVYTSNCYASIDGVSVQNNSSLNFPTNGELVLGTIPRAITHNADGTKTDATSSASFSGYGISGGNVSVTFALPTIPRASGVACTSANIGEKAIITINRKSDTFKHTLSYNFYGVTGTIAIRTANTVEPFELPSTFYAKIPNDPSGTGTVYCTTYDNAGNQVGDTTYCNFTAYVNKDNNKPNLTISVVDTGITLPTGVKTTSLTGSNKKLINNWSSAKVTATATGKNSATIKSTKVTSGDGQSSTSLTPTFTKVHSSTFTVSATDSRDIPNTATATGMSLIPYTEIQTTTVKLKRESQTSSVVTIELAGKYFNGSFGSVTNDITLKYRYRVVGGSWSGYTSLSLTKSSGTFSYKNTSLRTDCNYQTAYEFQFVLTDKVNVYTLTLKDITKGIPVFDYGEDDFKVNYPFYAAQDIYTIYNGTIRESLTFKGRVGIVEGYVNFNDAITTGIYSVGSTESVTGAPYTGAIYGILEVKVSDMTAWNKTNNWIWQKFTSTGGATYIRHAVNAGSFTAWKLIYNESDRKWLYTNTAGNNGTINMVESAANYKFLEIYFKNNDGYHGSVKIEAPDGKQVNLLSHYNSTSELIFKAAIVTISGKTISRNTYCEHAVSTGTAVYDYNYIYITKVIGYTI